MALDIQNGKFEKAVDDVINKVQNGRIETFEGKVKNFIYHANFDIQDIYYKKLGTQPNTYAWQNIFHQMQQNLKQTKSFNELKSTLKNNVLRLVNDIASVGDAEIWWANRDMLNENSLLDFYLEVILKE